MQGGEVEGHGARLKFHCFRDPSHTLSWESYTVSLFLLLIVWPTDDISHLGNLSLERCYGKAEKNMGGGFRDLNWSHTFPT